MTTHTQRIVSGTVRVIRDPSDARKDYHLPLAEAQALYKRGLLAYDATNATYCENRTTS